MKEEGLQIVEPRFVFVTAFYGKELINELKNFGVE